MIKEIHDKHQWNDFLLKRDPNTFLQSWEWGQVQKSDGEEVKYMGIFEQDKLIGACLLLTINARRGRHWLIPHGPIFKTEEQTRNYLPEIVKHIIGNYAANSVALRIAPLLESTPENTSVFQNLGFRPTPLHVHAELTWVLDIGKPKEAILTGMRKTTRHAIRKAEQFGVTIEIISQAKDLDRFMPLYQQTKQRHAFVPYSRQFLEIQLNHMNSFAVFASHSGRDLAAAICFQFGSTVFYYHGASVKSSVPAAHLLQWRAIQEAKRRGAKRYNFWGIAPDNKPNHPFTGITVFKKGFGGYTIDYMHAQDLPLSFKYWKLWSVDTYRKIKRGF